jgi:hypothetical protein
MLAWMASLLVESALSRRYVLGPLIALALVGGSSPVRRPGAALPAASASPTPSPTASTPLASAEKLLLAAHDAEGVYYVDNLVYAAGVGTELAALKGIEPEVRWGIAVIVQEPSTENANDQVTILRAPLPGGGSLCMSEVSEDPVPGTYFARVRGASKCPPRTATMAGWSQEQAAGWGA